MKQVKGKSTMNFNLEEFAHFATRVSSQDSSEKEFMSILAATTFNKVVMKEVLGYPKKNENNRIPIILDIGTNDYSCPHGAVTVSQITTLKMVRDALKKIILLSLYEGKWVGIRIVRVENKRSDNTLIKNLIDEKTGLAWLKVEITLQE